MKWISTKNELPKDYHTVLVVFETNSKIKFASMAYRDENCWYYWHGITKIHGKVIYWMAFPRPPKDWGSFHFAGDKYGMD